MVGDIVFFSAIWSGDERPEGSEKTFLPAMLLLMVVVMCVCVFVYPSVCVYVCARFCVGEYTCLVWRLEEKIRCLPLSL